MSVTAGRQFPQGLAFIFASTDKDAEVLRKEQGRFHRVEAYIGEIPSQINTT